jgi:hypothetical protein
VLTEQTDSVTNNGAEPRLYTDIAGQTGITVGGYINSYGANAPTVFAQQCSGPSVWSSIWMSCPAGDSISNNYAPIGALLLQTGLVSSAEPGGYKGRLNLMAPYGVLGSMAATHLITLGDSNPAKTLATPGHRPTNDANDTWIGLDQGSSVAAKFFQLAFGAPQSISNYIGNTGDDTNWLERFQTGLKTFKVQIQSTVALGTAPFLIASRTPVLNLTADNNPTVQSCGTTTACSAISPVHTAQIVFGTLPLSGGTATLTGIAPAFSSAASFNCVANDVTNQTNGVKALPASGSSVVFTGSGSDVISYQCVGSEP